MSIARVALPVATSQLFDYWIPAGADVRAGAIVKVSLGRRRIAGVVTELASEASVPRDRIVPIDEVVALPPLPDDVRDLCAFVAAYYQAPLGLAFALAMPPLRAGRAKRRHDERPLALSAAGRTALPPALMRAPVARALFARLEPDGAVLDADAIAALSRTARRVLHAWLDRGYVAPATMLQEPPAPLQLNDAQRAAVDAIDAARETFAPFLLDGVTGSGKTEVYLSAAARSVASGGQVLMLVPEINLTPQLVARVRQALPRARTVALHSGLPEGERRCELARGCGRRGRSRARHAARRSSPRCRVSTSSSSTRSTTARTSSRTCVRYHARDAALWRGAAAGRARRARQRDAIARDASCNADAGRYKRLVLERRADPRALPPTVRFVPARGDSVRDGLSAHRCSARSPTRLASRRAIARIREPARVRAVAQVCRVRVGGGLPALQRAAGRASRCPRRLRLPSLRPSRARAARVPAVRQRRPCAARATARSGSSARLRRASPTRASRASIATRTRRAGAFDEVRSRVAANTLDILIGTQMLAKGHDFPAPDARRRARCRQRALQRRFPRDRAACRAARAGWRAGQGAPSLPGEVIVQTDFPAASALCRAAHARLWRVRARAARRAPRRAACRRSRTSCC